MSCRHRCKRAQPSCDDDHPIFPKWSLRLSKPKGPLSHAQPFDLNSTTRVWIDQRLKDGARQPWGMERRITQIISSAFLPVLFVLFYPIIRALASPEVDMLGTARSSLGSLQKPRVWPPKRQFGRKMSPTGRTLDQDQRNRHVTR